MSEVDCLKHDDSEKESAALQCDYCYACLAEQITSLTTQVEALTKERKELAQSYKMYIKRSEEVDEENETTLARMREWIEKHGRHSEDCRPIFCKEQHEHSVNVCCPCGFTALLTEPGE